MRDFFFGMRCFWRGLGILVRAPRLLLLGVLPALLTALLLLAAMVGLFFVADDVAAWLTPFADDWAGGLRTAVRVAFGVAVLAAALVVALISFSALTIAVGGPFYEHIAEQVDDSPGVDLSFWRLFSMSVRDAVVLVARSLLFTVPLLVAGFIPVVGQTVVPVLLVFVTAWFLALELVAVSFYRRGMDLRQRREVLGRRRGLALGLGLPASLLCAVPLLAIVVMPIGFVGGVLVAREALAE